MPLKILDLGRQFRPKTSITYPPFKNGRYMEEYFYDYSTNTGFNPYNFTSVNEFINKMSPSWLKVVEQFVPATTLWTGGNLIGNNIKVDH